MMKVFYQKSFVLAVKNKTLELELLEYRSRLLRLKYILRLLKYEIVHNMVTLHVCDIHMGLSFDLDALT